MLTDIDVVILASENEFSRDFGDLKLNIHVGYYNVSLYDELIQWCSDIGQPNGGIRRPYYIYSVKMAESLNPAVEKPRTAPKTVFRANNGPLDQSVE